MKKALQLNDESTLKDVSIKIQTCIVEKGPSDKITLDELLLECIEEGSPRRCGGQGDILAGVIGVLLSWSNKEEIKSKLDLPASILASYSGCLLVRKCARSAFSKHFRSTTTPNIIEEIGPVVQSLFPSSL